MVQPARDGIPGVQNPNLFFSTNIKGAIAKADLIFLCVPTPTKCTGAGAGRAADMVYVEAAARMIAEVAMEDKIVVEKSTVPCRTAEDIRKTFAAVGRPGVHFEILSNPEFLAEGSAINDLLYPDRVLIGSLKTKRGLQAATALADVYGKWVPHSRIITMNLWSSEMAKLSANALLAQRISSINALSAVCEATGADIEEVSYACGLDNRIGSHMLKSSVGFGGSCFKKDVLSLVYIAETHNLSEVAAFWKSVIDINEYQKDRFIKRIVKCLFSTLTNKRVAILGYAYKKDTGDTRESAAIGILNHLLIENAEVRIYDPKVEGEQIWQSLKESNNNKGFELAKQHVAVCQTSYEACENADAVVIATEWDEFSNKTTNRPGGPPRKASCGPRASFEHSGSASYGTDTSPTSSTIDLNADSPTADNSLRSSLTNTSSECSTSEGQAPAIIDMLNSVYPFRGKDNLYTSKVINPEINNANHPKSVRNSKAERGAKENKMDWSRIARAMRRPMYVFDGRNIVDAEKLGRLGFRVEAIGKAGTGGRQEISEVW